MGPVSVSRTPSTGCAGETEGAPSIVCAASSEGRFQTDCRRVGFSPGALLRTVRPDGSETGPPASSTRAIALAATVGMKGWCTLADASSRIFDAVLSVEGTRSVRAMTVDGKPAPFVIAVAQGWYRDFLDSLVIGSTVAS